MNRQLLAIALGSVLALPALANNEIDAGNLPADIAPSLSRAQVRAELIAAQQRGETIVNAELGTVARFVPRAGKSRDEVVGELIAAQRAGEVVVNAELGTIARSMWPAGVTREPVFVELTLAQL